MKDNVYGNGENPPYSLYQGPDGKWGLVDRDGRRLEAVFNRADDRFSRVPWEVVTFDEREGFELLAWYDPDETWFNFTYDNDDYPARWAKLLWMHCEKSFDDYRRMFPQFLPVQDRWLIEAIGNILAGEKDIEEQCGRDYEKAEAECETMLRGAIDRYPAIVDFKTTGLILAPILDSPNVTTDAKARLWHGKVHVDSLIRDLYAAE